MKLFNIRAKFGYEIYGQQNKMELMFWIKILAIKSYLLLFF